MELNEAQTNQLQTFLMACDDFILGKFILADAKSAKILQAIEESELISQLITDCLVGFDFKKEFDKVKSSFKTRGFKLPDEPAKIVAFTIHLLKDFLERKDDFPAFLRNFFPFEDGKNSFELFCEKVMTVFKNQVANILEMDIWTAIKTSDDQDEDEEEDDDERLSSLHTFCPVDSHEFFSNMKISISQIYDVVKADKKVKPNQKNDFLFFLSGFQESCAFENVKIFTAFYVAFLELFKKMRSIKFYREELSERVDVFFSTFK